MPISDRVASLKGEDSHLQSSNTAEVVFILRADGHAASQAPRGGGHGDVVLRDHGTLVSELGEDVGVMFRSFRGERFNAGNPPQGLQPGQTPRRTSGGIREPDASQSLGPDHGG